MVAVAGVVTVVAVAVAQAAAAATENSNRLPLSVSLLVFSPLGRPVVELLLLPDLDSFFAQLQRRLASSPGGLTVGGCDSDENALLADGDNSQAVDDGNSS